MGVIFAKKRAVNEKKGESEKSKDLEEKATNFSIGNYG